MAIIENQTSSEGTSESDRKAQLKKKSDNEWVPSGGEAYLHSRFYESEPDGGPSIDEGWADLADDDSLLQMSGKMDVSPIELEEASKAYQDQLKRIVDVIRENIGSESDVSSEEVSQ